MVAGAERRLGNWVRIVPPARDAAQGPSCSRASYILKLTKSTNTDFAFISSLDRRILVKRVVPCSSRRF